MTTIFHLTASLPLQRMVNVFFVVVIDILDRQIQDMVLLSESPLLYFLIHSIDYHGTDQYTEIYNWEADIHTIAMEKSGNAFYWTGHWTIIALRLSLNYRRHGHHRSIHPSSNLNRMTMITKHHRMSDIAGHCYTRVASVQSVEEEEIPEKMLRMSWNSSNGSSCAVVTIGSQQSTLFCHRSTFN